MLEAALSRPEPAALLVEPVQGEGGVRVPAPGFLRRARELCDRHGAMLIVDEVQTGLGRLGAWWGCAAEAMTPDILLAGKALGGGVLPVGAMLTSSRWYEPFNRDPLLHSSTFAGNPLAAVAVTATLAAIDGEGLVERARDLGEHLLTRIREIVAHRCADAVVEVRGRGLLIGVEFAKASTAADLMTELLRRKVLTSFPLNTHTVLRFTPPAVLTERDVDWLLSAFDEAAGTVGRRRVGLIGRS
jgi:putrescine aminotransferase